MAYVNVKDWSVDQVTEWLKGLDNVILPYTNSFLNNGVTGNQLLQFRADDLENLGVKIIGHQEIILEAVEHLRNFHYELEKENIQLFALRLSCAANSLFKELQYAVDSSETVQTETMAGVHNIILTVKPLVCWLKRSPFVNDREYLDNQIQLLRLCVEMAFTAHRDKFSQTPVTTIRNNCEKLVCLADYIIQDVKDPLILQPASLELTTLRKKEQELGLYIFPSYLYVHQIAEVKHGSPAHLSRKIEKGDEIVQVNYQTVVGWQREKVMLLLQDSSPEVLLTLKKRPQHTKVYGPIYMKPYRLPSKKRGTPYSRWNENLPSPRLLTINDLPQIPIPKSNVKSSLQELESESSSDNDTDTPDSPLNEPPSSLFPLKSRPVLQRRNTITGASPTSTKPYPGIEQFLKMYKPEALHSSSYHIESNKFEDESSLLRDKSASCSLGLELTPRPTTVIGISQNRNINRQNSIKNSIQEKSTNKKVMFEENNVVLKNYYNSNLLKDAKYALSDSLKLNEEKSVSVNSLNSLSGAKETIDFIDEAEDLTDRSNMLNKECENSESDNIIGDNGGELKENFFRSEFKDVHVHNIIKKFDEKITLQESNIVINSAIRTKIQNRLVTGTTENTFSKTESLLNSSSVINAEKMSETKIATINKLNHDENVLNNDVKFIDSEDCVKYELGIPIVETKNTYIIIPAKETNNTMENLIADVVVDVPPKPPPRSSITDSYRPKYPADSPKPFIDASRRQQLYLKENISSKLEMISQKPSTSIPGEAIAPPSYQTNFMEIMPDVIEHVPDAQTPPRKSDAKPISSLNSKHIKMDQECDSPKSMNSSPKSLTMSKVSPTNSIVRAMMYSNKAKNGKKKNTLTAKKRKVSVNDVSPGDMEGFLYQRFRTRDSQKAYWDKLWFVLIGNRLYGFSSKEALKADVLIYLTGFTVCLATEVKSRSNAFKVYHTGTVFYFSAETHETTLAWIEYITAATLHSDAKPSENILYSETDDSDTEKPKTPTEKASEGIKKFGSLKKFTSKKSNDPSSHSGSTSLDRKWFFNKSTSSKNSVPIPTAQFRSYRKIPTTPTESISTGNFTSHIPNFATRLDMQPFSSSQNISVPNLSIDLPKQEKAIPNTLTPKSKTNNFSHSSNPSLYNVSDFHPFYHKSQHQTRENLAGFVTLEELMNRQSEEQKLNPLHNQEVINVDLIKPDVVYGEVPIRPKGKSVEKKRSFKSSTSSSESKKNESESSSFCFGRKSSKKGNEENNEINVATYPKSKQQDLKNNRSLPRAHKLLENYDTYSISSSNQYSDSCKSLAKLEDNFVEDNLGYGQDEFGETRIRRESMEKLSRIEVVNSNVKLKSAMQYTPLALPLVDDKAKMNPKLAFELNLDEKSHKGGKLMSFFHKQSDHKKEKHLMGSPNVHRTIFRKPSSSEDDWRHQSQLQSNLTHLNAMNPQDKEDLASGRVIQHIDYPGLEYPPVFEPETYSLSDPQSSLTILRKQGKN